jgi:hypothetical protein
MNKANNQIVRDVFLGVVNEAITTSGGKALTAAEIQAAKLNKVALDTFLKLRDEGKLDASDPFEECDALVQFYKFIEVQVRKWLKWENHALTNMAHFFKKKERTLYLANRKTQNLNIQACNAPKSKPAGFKGEQEWSF